MRMIVPQHSPHLQALNDSFRSIGSDESTQSVGRSSFSKVKGHNTQFVPSPASILPTGPRSPHQKGVRFSDAPPTQYEDQSGFSQCAGSRWYTRTEIKQFKTHAKCIAIALIQADQEKDNLSQQSWLSSLQQAYVTFSSSLNDDLSSQVQMPLVRAAPSLVGLDSIAVRAIVEDRKQRRKALLECFADLDESVPDMSERSRLMALASAAMSLPARRYAVHVAQWWWLASVV